MQQLTEKLAILSQWPTRQVIVIHRGKFPTRTGSIIYVNCYRNDTCTTHTVQYETSEHRVYTAKLDELEVQLVQTMAEKLAILADYIRLQPEGYGLLLDGWWRVDKVDPREIREANYLTLEKI